MPCILISLTGDSGKGSGRSIKGFNLYAALEKNAHLLEKYGGHELAVGLSLDRSNLEAFREALENYADAFEGAFDTAPYIDVDCAVSPSELSVYEVEQLNVLEPFGMGNPQPSFPTL